ncbi:MAG: hypothetical protein GEV05_23265 [Betaproteobacteria bacterium]|nr:hypothetical protein [Betaproteobacteria bacterium]
MPHGPRDTDRKILQIDATQDVAEQEGRDAERYGQPQKAFGELLGALDHQPDAGNECDACQEQACGIHVTLPSCLGSDLFIRRTVPNRATAAITFLRASILKSTLRALAGILRRAVVRNRVMMVASIRATAAKS